MMFCTPGSGDSPMRSDCIVQQPKHSTPVKCADKNGPVLFTSVGNSLPTPVYSDTSHSSPAERDTGSVASLKNSKHSLARKVSSSSSNTDTTNGAGYHGYASKLKQMQVSGMSEGELSIIQKQRQELQLLISELRERDRELNDMVSSHQSQLLAWEEDRQKLLTAEQKCGHHENDIKEYKKNLNRLAAYVKTLKAERQIQLTDFQQVRDQLHKLNQENGNQSVKLTEFQMKDKNMSENVKAMSTAIGQLEAREMELTTLVKLKDKELTEASALLTELKQRLTQMDVRCKESHELVSETQRQAKDWKLKYSDLKRDHDRLRENFNSVMSQSQNSLQELEGSRKKIGDLERELALAGERECRQNDMMESIKSKEERSAQELATLRQLYDRQQRELSLLQLNLDSSQEIIQKQQATLNHSQSDTILQGSANSPRSVNGRVTFPLDSSARESEIDELSQVHDGILSQLDRKSASHEGIWSLSPRNGTSVSDRQSTSSSQLDKKLSLQNGTVSSRTNGTLSSQANGTLSSQASGTLSSQANGTSSSLANGTLSSQSNGTSSGYVALSSNSVEEESETSLKEERQKFDELYMKFLEDPDCPGTAESSLISIHTGELDMSLTTGKEEMISPTSKLHRLLAESRLMVQKLEQSTLAERSNPAQVTDTS